MQKITAIIRVERLAEVRAALDAKGYPGLMLTYIEGHGAQKGVTQQFRGRSYTIELLPKCKLEIVVRDDEVKKIVETIIESARTGAVGDGKIFVSPVTSVYRIRTGEAGEQAV
jgi:nitrogen regulatory protein PII